MFRIKGSFAETLAMSGLVGWVLLIVPVFEAVMQHARTGSVELPLVVFIVICVAWTLVAISAGHACNKKCRRDVPTEVRSRRSIPVACVAKVYPPHKDRYDALVFYGGDDGMGAGRIVTVNGIAFDVEEGCAFIEEIGYGSVVYGYSGASLLFEVVDDAPVSETKRVLHLSESAFREAFDA